MKQLLLTLCLALMMIGTANAEVITFDDFTINGPEDNAPWSGYGFNWYNGGVATATQPSGYMNAAISGPNYFHSRWNPQTNFLVTITRSDMGNFDFNSAYFTAAWYNGLGLEMIGYRDGSEVRRSFAMLDTNVSQLLTVDFMDIDVLTLNTFGDNASPAFFPVVGTRHNFAMDNFSFSAENGDVPPSVPEPSTIAFMSIGLLGMFAWRRRKN